jgi:TetR/AcrR family transcriptional regulator, regulator of cefoperazone and chloramphenicol sensitivity
MRPPHASTASSGRPLVMRRPEETRQRLIVAALHEFAKHGYEHATVRNIIGRAGASQAAINYHFKGKRELYLMVLRASFEALTGQAQSTFQGLQNLHPDEALRQFVRAMMIPILKSQQSNTYRKLLAWEAISPSGVLSDFMNEAISPCLAAARQIVERLLIVKRSKWEISIAAFWLVGQCIVFHQIPRDAASAFGSEIGERATEIADLVYELAHNGLSAFAASLKQGLSISPGEEPF